MANAKNCACTERTQSRVDATRTAGPTVCVTNSVLLNARHLLSKVPCVLFFQERAGSKTALSPPQRPRHKRLLEFGRSIPRLASLAAATNPARANEESTPSWSWNGGIGQSANRNFASRHLFEEPLGRMLVPYIALLRKFVGGGVTSRLAKERADPCSIKCRLSRETTAALRAGLL